MPAQGLPAVQVAHYQLGKMEDCIHTIFITMLEAFIILPIRVLPTILGMVAAQLMCIRPPILAVGVGNAGKYLEPLGVALRDVYLVMMYLHQ